MSLISLKDAEVKNKANANPRVLREARHRLSFAYENQDVIRRPQIFLGSHVFHQPVVSDNGT